MRSKVINHFWFLLVVLFLCSVAGASTPDWLRSLAQQPQRKYADDVDAVVLLDEQETAVRDNGEIVSHYRIAFRILRPEGRGLAQHEVQYDSETKLNSFHGW